MLHPEQEFEVEVDGSSFRFKYGTSAQYMEIEDAIASIHEMTLRDVYAMLINRLANPVDEKRLTEETTPNQLVTLLLTLGDHQTLSELEAKKSKQPSPLNNGPSAAAATPAEASAAK
jgi:hypothetical protein